MKNFFCSICNNDLGFGINTSRGEIICNDCIKLFKKLLEEDEGPIDETDFQNIKEASNRKIIQFDVLTDNGITLTVLCDDGSMWYQNYGANEWKKISDIPKE